jgi:hypothetical protein
MGGLSSVWFGFLPFGQDLLDVLYHNHVLQYDIRSNVLAYCDLLDLSLMLEAER